MDAAIKQKWVEALRSGEYQQGHSQLRSDDDKYCCLGVLCNIVGLPIARDGMGVAGSADDSYGPIREIVGPTSTLWWMNDQEKKSFPEIADYIEREL